MTGVSRPLPRTALLLLALVLSACAAPDGGDPLFTLLPPEQTGIDFRNEIVEDEGFNVLEYEYFYNGGGVAAGDVNGDGLPDLFFTANAGANRLYVNRGDMRFEDVTRRAGLSADPGWNTGVTMADVNGDGHLDIYVCRSGNVAEARRRNLLYINNGDLTFTERAADFGLDSPAYSTHASFFDYDGDGDLDMFLVNHPIRRFAFFDVSAFKQQRDTLAGDHLYRNDGGRFVDVSEAAGIIQNPIGYGLSAQVADVNGDGRPDVYVANDYVEDDYLYLNQGDGTFRESVRMHLTYTSYSSMGTDIADYNNDGLVDIVTLDMLPADHRRQKLLKGPDDNEQFQMLRRQGYHPQYMRNMLHLNNGDGTFSEIGQLAGISNTDWSWAVLLSDFDNDGFKDLFVTNGYMRDYTNLDFLEYELRPAMHGADEVPALELVKSMPISRLANYMFRNRGDLTFADVTEAWGFGATSLSNGAAYADLDLDGDLDLVVNNINDAASVYRNDLEHDGEHNYLRVELVGDGGNTAGIGARLEVRAGGERFVQELVPARGYQSSVEPVFHVGLGKATRASVALTWPDGAHQELNDLAVNRTVRIARSNAPAQARSGTGTGASEAARQDPSPRYFLPLHNRLGIDFLHEEDPYVDFEREPLLPHMLSRLGPALARADVNRDGLHDVFVGGAAGQSAALYLQQVDGSFARVEVDVFDEHAEFEDVEALFLDVDADGDADLYVAGGGNFAFGETELYRDRLYLNDGFGRFEYAPDRLPQVDGNAGALAATDVDGDGDTDLFVGERVLSGSYPISPQSHLLLNEGGRFVDATPEAIRRPGMVTDAIWADIDGDGSEELVLAGEWMSLRVFRHAGGRAFTDITARLGLQRSRGWWNAVAALDLDGDGDLDLIAGNRGLNAQMQAEEGEPASITAADFDFDGRIDAVMSYYVDGIHVPVPARDELFRQLPTLAHTYPTYASYADETMEGLFPAEELEGALKLSATVFGSGVFENRGDDGFVFRALPVEAQFAPVNDLIATDLDGDNRPDLLLAGNEDGVRAQWGVQDASRGLLLLNRGDMTFEPRRRSGFHVEGTIRNMLLVPTANGTVVVAAANDGPVQVLAYLGAVERRREAAPAP